MTRDDDPGASNPDPWQELACDAENRMDSVYLAGGSVSELVAAGEVALRAEANALRAGVLHAQESIAADALPASVLDAEQLVAALDALLTELAHLDSDEQKIERLVRVAAKLRGESDD